MKRPRKKVHENDNKMLIFTYQTVRYWKSGGETGIPTYLSGTFHGHRLSGKQADIIYPIPQSMYLWFCNSSCQNAFKLCQHMKIAAGQSYSPQHRLQTQKIRNNSGVHLQISDEIFTHATTRYDNIQILKIWRIYYMLVGKDL